MIKNSKYMGEISQQQGELFMKNELRIPTREEFHRTYGGEIYPSDFNYESKNAARRICSSFAFDEHCIKNRSMKGEIRMLRYENGGNCIHVDLHNNFTITAMANWNNNLQRYLVKFYINRQDIDLLDLVEENVEISADSKDLKVTLAKLITERLNSGYYHFYMERYNEQINCFDAGSAVLDGKKESQTPEVNHHR